MRRNLLFSCRMALAFSAIVFAASIASLSGEALAGGETIPFDDERWDLAGAVKTEYLGRECIAGSATLRNVEFEDGTMEVDMAFTGARAYAGFVFRMKDPQNYESFYIRPHRGGLYGDDLQYTPVTNGISSWQLYSGEGFSSSWDVPAERWFHVRMEVKGEQARVFVDGAEAADLVIDRLIFGRSKGAAGVQGQADGTAYFSDFRYTPGGAPGFDPPVPAGREPGFITGWKISQVFRAGEVDVENGFGDALASRIEWRDAETDGTGLLDIARTFARTGREPDLVFVKAVIESEKDQRREYRFGYSDYINIFLDGELLFSGNSAYRMRDPSFLGIIGLHDSVVLPLKKGGNELVILVAESMGGWGLIFQDATAAVFSDQVGKGWELREGFRTPESVLFDGKRGVAYVSNFDQYNFRNPAVPQYISRIGLDGRMKEIRWADGLANPTGLAMHGDRLFAVERSGVAEIDPDTGAIAGRNAVPGAVFLNDIAIDASGRVYVSDSGKNVIHRWDGVKWEEWLTAPDISNPNALLAFEGRLYIGNNGTGRLLSADIGNGEITEVARLGRGNIDGIKPEGNGALLVSHWEGELFRVAPGGAVEKLFDTRAVRRHCADFDYVPGEKLVIVPAFFSDRVDSYRLGD